MYPASLENMDRTPLVPVTITDKNGVVTTRHKKIASPSPSSSRGIPAPQGTTKVPAGKAEEMLANLKLLRRGSAVYKHLYHVIASEMSVSEFEKAESLFNAPVNNAAERDSGRRWAVQKILEQSGDKGWRFDAAIALAYETDLNSRWYLPFINTLAQEDGYERIVRGYTEAAPEDQAKLVGIANALSEIEQRHEDRGHSDALPGSIIQTASSGRMRVTDQTLYRALVEHPEKAAQITKLYVERWSLDALDEALNAPSAIVEGAL